MPPPIYTNSTPIDVYVVGACETSAFALPQSERLRRSLLDITPFHFHSSLDDAPLGQRALLVRADWVVEKRILHVLTSREGQILQEMSGGPVHVAAFVNADRVRDAIQLLADQPSKAPGWCKGFKIGSAAEIAGNYERKLRKRQAPMAALLNEESRDAVERALFRAAYKGATDFVTKYFWPVPAFHAVRALAKRDISPNVITLISLFCVIATFVLFWFGYFWTGLASAFLMAFLDTVDGKLARVTITSSRAGQLLDHGIDLISPPFWWGAWFAGVLNSPWGATDIFRTWGSTAFWNLMLLYLLVRAVESIFSKRFAIHIHIWRPIDFAFRQITTRRNVNLTILAVGMLFGRPDLAFLAVAAWAMASFAFHFARLGQALFQQARGVEVRSWLSESLPSKSTSA